MLLHDPYAGNRKWWDHNWEPDGNSRDWTDWDYVLADVFQVIEDFTDKSNGQYLPYDQSGEVHWDVKSKFSGHDEAIEKHRENHEAKPGESFYAVPVFDDPDNPPTLATWMQDIAEDKADLRPDVHRDARPPTGDELRLAMEALRGESESPVE